MQGSQNWTCSTFTTLFESTGKDWHKNLLSHFATDILPLPISSPISFSSSPLPEHLISRIQLKVSSTQHFRRIWRKARHVAHITVKLPLRRAAKRKEAKDWGSFSAWTQVKQQDTFKGYERDVSALPLWEYEFSSDLQTNPLLTGSIPCCRQNTRVWKPCSNMTRQDFPTALETAELVHNRKDKTLKFYLSFWLL